ncbi:4-oxalocrotonate tautomerase [Paenibacillus sediminis]|uniref:Tautomerase n=1 Tax=Paenibacillus sediminis TaxID=664909 RepID=A0ABS4GYA6_9BACL|nr:4-oxalocrotonate tautomerase [Paenibacillus sediminis]MBP1935248.1 4-oxalocrotonate tautomerase [Paenibacillus sediminis]
MPIINIQLLEGRPPEKIKALIASVTDAVASELDSPKEKIRVLVSEIPTTHWGIGGKSVSDINHQ